MEYWNCDNVVEINFGYSTKPMDEYAKLRKEYVEQTRKNLIGEKLRRNGFEYYIQEISEAVETYARNENIDLEIFRWDILPQAIDILKDLRHAMISYEDRMQEMEE